MDADSSNERIVESTSDSAQLLIRRVLVLWMGGHPTLWRHGVLARRLLLLLQVLLVLEVLLWSHVGCRHAGLGGHARLASWHLSVRIVLRGLDAVVGIDAIRVSRCGLGGVQARLRSSS
jgi:hypothetical protein